MQYIKFGNNFNQTIDFLPDSVINLVLGHEFNNTIDNLPCSVSYLELGSKFNKSLCVIPIKLSKLILHKNFYDKNINIINEIIKSNENLEITYI